MRKFSYIRKIFAAFDMKLFDERELTYRLANEARYVCMKLKQPMLIH